MSIDLRRCLGALTTSLTLCLLLSAALPSQAAEKARLRVDDYQIDAVLDPHLHQITAKARVKFTALQDLSVAVFELHNDLRVTKVTDEKNQPLSAERVTQDSTVRVPLPAGLSKDSSTSLTFEYEGRFENADNSPVPGLSLAYIGDDTSYLALCRTMVPGQRLRSEPLHVHHSYNAAGAYARDRQRQGKHGGSPRVEQTERECPANENLHIRLGEAKLSGHDRRRCLSGTQERRGGIGSARLL